MSFIFFPLMTNFQGLQRNLSFVDFHLITAMLFFFIYKRVINVQEIYLYLLWIFFLKCLKDAGISYDAKLLLNAISYVFR